MNTFNKTERVFIEDKIKHLDVWWERFNKQSISLNNIETENYLLVISVPNQKMTLKRKKLFKSERFWYKRMKENERN